MTRQQQVFQRLLSKRTAFEYRQNAILRGEIPIDDSFDVALDELDKEETPTPAQMDNSILMLASVERIGK
jgi:hypothetical protein